MAGELKNSQQWRLIGIVLSAAWIALTGAYGLMQAGAKAHREAMLCYQMQTEAKTAPQCAAADAALQTPLCGWKNATCSASALDYPTDLAYTAAIAVVPPALIWIFVFWRRRGQGGAVA
jgi:hypothetical protein